MRKMLRPAILYKEEIEQEIRKKYYTDDMFYASASLENFMPSIKDDATYEGCFRYAVIDDADKLIGYIEYQVNYYVSRASMFLMFSFADTLKEKYQFGKTVHEIIDGLTHQVHSIEWRAVQGNPACRAYDKIAERYHGNKLVYRDACRDKYGNYHDDYTYEIIC